MFDEEIKIALEKDDIIYIENLINSGVSNDVLNNALTFAIELKRIKIAKLLINNNASLNKEDDINDLELLISVSQANENLEDPEYLKDLENLINFLILSGCDINETDQLGRTPLILSALSGNIKNVSIFIKYGANIEKADFNGINPILAACKNSDLKTIKYLVDRGAKLEVFNNDGNSILHFITEKGDIDALNFLISIFDKKDLKNIYQETPIIYASKFSNVNFSEFIKIFTENLLSLNEKDVLGRTALHHAALNTKFQNVKCLVENNCEVNALDNFDYTPLHLACSPSSKDCEEIVKVIKFLIDNGAWINHMSLNGKTPLMYAISNHYSEKVTKKYTYIVKCLLEYNVDTEIEDAYGHKAINKARDKFLDLYNSIFEFDKYVVKINSYSFYGEKCELEKIKELLTIYFYEEDYKKKIHVIKLLKNIFESGENVEIENIEIENIENEDLMYIDENIFKIFEKLKNSFINRIH